MNLATIQKNILLDITTSRREFIQEINQNGSNLYNKLHAQLKHSYILFNNNSSIDNTIKTLDLTETKLEDQKQLSIIREKLYQSLKISNHKIAQLLLAID